MKIKTFFSRGLLFLSAVSFFCACQSSRSNDLPELQKYMLLINSQGKLTTASSQKTNLFTKAIEKYHPLDSMETQQYFSNIFLNIDSLRKDTLARAIPVRKILFYVHGGMNTRLGTIEKVRKDKDELLAAGYYPIFVNWHSSLLSCYIDHLLFIREGVDIRQPFHDSSFITASKKNIQMVIMELMAPLFFDADIVRGISSAPGIWISRVGEVLGDSRNFDAPNKQDAKDTPFHKNTFGKATIWNGIDQQDFGHLTQHNLMWLEWSGLKIFSTPFLDAFGRSAWDVMLRRSRLLFSQDTALDIAQATTIPILEPSTFRGGLRQFTDAWQKDTVTNKLPLRVLGHSMGSIVLNEWLRTYPEIRVDQIDYMAAACTVRDFEQSVYPYARHYHDTIPITLHTLHETAEKMETPVEHMGMSPTINGSLLVWIDGFFGNPLTGKDRTLGRFSNLPYISRCSPELQSHLTIKKYPYGNTSKQESFPQAHGEFSFAQILDTTLVLDSTLYIPRKKTFPGVYANLAKNTGPAVLILFTEFFLLALLLLLVITTVEQKFLKRSLLTNAYKFGEWMPSFPHILFDILLMPALLMLPMLAFGLANVRLLSASPWCFFGVLLGSLFAQGIFIWFACHMKGFKLSTSLNKGLIHRHYQSLFYSTKFLFKIFAFPPYALWKKILSGLGWKNSRRVFWGTLILTFASTVLLFAWILEQYDSLALITITASLGVIGHLIMILFPLLAWMLFFYFVALVGGAKLMRRILQ